MKPIRKLLKSRALTATSAAILTAVALGGIAAATTPPTNTILACTTKTGGIVRIVTSFSQCNTKLENTISWNVVGPQGAQGPAGPVGPAGAKGATGATGPAGATGATGATGAAGPAGAIGPIGLTGLTGATGADGVAGQVGPTGPAGADGAPGPAGPQGPAGAPGAPGAAGAPGVTNVDGLQGGSCNNGAGTFGVTYGQNGAVSFSCNLTNPVQLSVSPAGDLFLGPSNCGTGFLQPPCNYQRGSVQSSPAGINNCGLSGGVCVAQYAPGTVVTLTSNYANWTGACTGPTTTPCVVTLNTPKSVGTTW